MSVYGTVIVAIALTPIGFLLENHATTQYAITGITILLSTSLILGFVFVSKACNIPHTKLQLICYSHYYNPQMYSVYKDPEGKHVLEDPATSNRTSTILKFTISNENEETYKKRIESLNEEIKVLNDELDMV